MTATLDDLKRVSLTTTDLGVGGLTTQGSQRSHGSDQLNGKTKGIEKTDTVSFWICHKNHSMICFNFRERVKKIVEKMNESKTVRQLRHSLPSSLPS